MSDSTRAPKPAPPARFDKPTQVTLPRHRGRDTPPMLRLANLADVAAKQTEWLWSGRIPVARLTLLTGERGVGKSLAAMSIAASVTMGDALPGHEGRACIGTS